MILDQNSLNKAVDSLLKIGKSPVEIGRLLSNKNSYGLDFTSNQITLTISQRLVAQHTREANQKSFNENFMKELGEKTSISSAEFKRIRKETGL